MTIKRQKLIFILCLLVFIIGSFSFYRYGYLLRVSNGYYVPDVQLDFDAPGFAVDKNHMVCGLEVKMGKENACFLFEIPYPVPEGIVIKLDRMTPCMGGIMSYKQYGPPVVKYLEGEVVVEKAARDFIALKYNIRAELMRLNERRFVNMPGMEVDGAGIFRIAITDSLNSKWRMFYLKIKDIVPSGDYDRYIKRHEPFSAKYPLDNVK